MDSMQNELLQWRKENKEHALRLKEEDRCDLYVLSNNNCDQFLLLVL